MIKILIKKNYVNFLIVLNVVEEFYKMLKALKKHY